MKANYTNHNQQPISEQLRNIYQSTGFSLEMAQKLLKMIYIAVNEHFEETELTNQGKQEEWWQNANAQKTKTIEEKEYKILARFPIDEYWFNTENIWKGIQNTLTTDFLKFLKQPLELIKKSARDKVQFGFILYDDQENIIYIIIRGTQTGPEWYNNLNFKPEEESFLGDNQLGKIHKGFNHIYTKSNQESNKPTMEKIVEKTLKELQRQNKLNSETKIYIAGHSLGAALATLTSVHVKKLGFDPILYTFASPRVGNKEFSKNFDTNSSTSITAYRVINSEDIIASVPLASAAIIPDDKEIITDSRIKENLEELSKNKTITTLVSPFVSNLDFYHVGQIVAFSLHKNSILLNHIVVTYMEALGVPDQ